MLPSSAAATVNPRIVPRTAVTVWCRPGASQCTRGLVQILAEEGERQRPRLIRRALVRTLLPALRTQEPVTGAVEDVALVRLALHLHRGLRGIERGVDARVASPVQSQHRRPDRGQGLRILRR